ncbi:MAG: MgtC/SapB family protein [Sphingomonadaceae bacterium]
MDQVQLLQPLALALAIGLLVGLERGWQARAEPAGHRVAGFRTFGLLGLLGGLAALLPPAFGAALLLGAAATLVVGYVRESTPDRHSATSTIAGLLTLALGAFAASGRAAEALAAAAVLVLLLALRHRLHALLRGISEDEIEAASRFAIVALVILPLMPDRAMGPLEAWNPRQLWLVVVFVSGLSFLGYAAARRLGAGRGLMVTAAAGGLVSSTSITVAYAGRLAAAQADRPTRGALIAGIAIASAVMFGRVLLLTALIAPMAFASLAFSIVPAGLVALGLAFLAARRAGEAGPAHPVALGNPLDFRPALQLAALVALLAVVVRWAIDRFGDLGLGVLLTLTGAGDVDAAIITLAGLPAGVIAPAPAGRALALAVIANTIVKLVLVLLIARSRAGLMAAGPLAAAALVAGGTLLLAA